MTIYHIITFAIFTILAINIVYFFFFAVAGKLLRITVPPNPKGFKKMIILIPAYKEDKVIMQTAAEALKQNYPSHRYEVMVIADSLKAETVRALREIPVRVHEVSFARSTKIKSLNSAMNTLQGFDAVVVLDSDNIMHPDFLFKMNRELHNGSKAVQGHRVAKNEDTEMAFLDAISEEINNHLFRKGHFVTGFSSSLIGSAMAFDFHLFKRLIRGIHSVGEDKELELAIIKEGEKIVYAEDALVYDEKVQDLEVFGNQRRRWLSSQLNIFLTYFLPSFILLFRTGNLDYFNKAMHSALIPRVLLLGFTSVMTIISLLIPSFPGSYYWTAMLLVYLLTLLISIPGRLYDKRIINAVLYVPKVFLTMFLLLFKLKGAGKTFSNTPHTVTLKK